MNLYFISQKENNGYDTYDSAVVCAPDEEAARLIHPGGGNWGDTYGTWAFNPSGVKVELIGVADPSVKQGIVLASFNAG